MPTLGIYNIKKLKVIWPFIMCLRTYCQGYQALSLFELYTVIFKISPFLFLSFHIFHIFHFSPFQCWALSSELAVWLTKGLTKKSEKPNLLQLCADGKPYYISYPRSFPTPYWVANPSQHQKASNEHCCWISYNPSETYHRQCQESGCNLGRYGGLSHSDELDV